MCMRRKHDCCIDHPDYLCPADLEPETRERMAREYGFVLECPDFELEEKSQEEEELMGMTYCRCERCGEDMLLDNFDLFRFGQLCDECRAKLAKEKQQES